MKPYFLERICIYLFALSLGLSSQAWCETELPPPLRIGAVLALTSDQAAPNKAFLEGIELAVDEVNQGPLWQGRKIELIAEDGRLLPKESFMAVKKLLDIDHVAALINGSVVESKAGGPLINKAKVPAITLWDASPEIEALGEYVFSIGLWTPGSAEVAASFAMSRLGKGRAFIFITEDQWSLELVKAFKQKFSLLGKDVAGVVSFNPGEGDFRSSLLRSRESNPDVLYITVGYNIAAFFQQLKQLHWKVPVITSDILSEDLLKSNPDLYEEVYQTQIYTPLKARTAHMLELYVQKFGRQCDWLPWVAWGYDALHLLARSLARVGPEGERIAMDLHTVKDFEGASGTITINEHRTSMRMPSVFQVRQGKFVLVE